VRLRSLRLSFFLPNFQDMGRYGAQRKVHRTESDAFNSEVVESMFTRSYFILIKLSPDNVLLSFIDLVRNE